MKNKALLIAAAALVLVTGAAYFLYDKLGEQVRPDNLAVESSEPASSGESASSEEDYAPEEVIVPDVTLYNEDGSSVQLSEFFGKPIVLNFWASWCGPCQSEMPDFNEAAARLEGEVQFIMLNSTDGQRETIETASAFIEEKGYTFPVYYDIDQQAAMIYGASALPTTFFIDSEGHAVAYAPGSIDAEALQMGLDMIME